MSDDSVVLSKGKKTSKHETKEVGFVVENTIRHNDHDMSVEIEKTRKVVEAKHMAMHEVEMKQVEFEKDDFWVKQTSKLLERDSGAYELVKKRPEQMMDTKLSIPWVVYLWYR